MNDEVNRLHLLTGRLFEKDPLGGGVEILVALSNAKANRLRPNDTVTIVAEGKKLPLTVVGTATSPKFIYVMKDPASLMPEPETFGIFMIPQNQAEQILNISGQINQVVVKLSPTVTKKKWRSKLSPSLSPMETWPVTLVNSS